MFNIPTIDHPTTAPKANIRGLMGFLQRYCETAEPFARFHHVIEKKIVTVYRMPDNPNRKFVPEDSAKPAPKRRGNPDRCRNRAELLKLSPGASIMLPVEPNTPARGRAVRHAVYEFARYYDRVGQYSTENRTVGTEQFVFVSRSTDAKP